MKDDSGQDLFRLDWLFSSVAAVDTDPDTDALRVRDASQMRFFGTSTNTIEVLRGDELLASVRGRHSHDCPADQAKIVVHGKGSCAIEGKLGARRADLSILELEQQMVRATGRLMGFLWFPQTLEVDESMDQQLAVGLILAIRMYDRACSGG